MKRRLFSQMIAFVLVISFLIPGITLPVTAVATDNDERTGNVAVDDSLTKKENPTIYGNTVLRADDPSIAKDSKILHYIDSAQFNAAKHTQRLTHLEDLNTYVFANADGTRSVYMMDENVKYIDKNGIVKEKDLTLTSKSGGFGIAQSDMDLLIPNDPVKGIDLAYSGFAVKLTPQGLESTTTAIQSGNSVVYEKAYGENTKLKYTPLLSGVKEDIILTEYTDDVTYTFVLETDGLSLYNNGSKYYLAENEKADPVFYLGEIIIYDAIGKPDMGTMTVETVTEGQKYLLTVIANEEFLSDPTTLYPVTIDPSLTISDTANGINAIEDSPIYAGYPNTKFGAYLFNPIGTPDSTFGIGRTVVRLNGLINSSAYTDIAAHQIQNVTFHILDVSGTASQNVKLHPLTGNTTWTESTVTWNNIGGYTTDANYGTSMGAGTWAAFNITGLVKAWKNNTYSQDAGFILVNENEANLKTFASSEYSTASYRPYVTMIYDPTSHGGDGFDDAEVITLNAYYTVNIDEQHELRYFKFVPASTGMYSFVSTANDCDPVVRLYNSSKQQIEYDDDSASNQNFCLTYHLMSGITYYIRAGCSNAGRYDICIRGANASSKINYTSMDLGTSRNISISTPHEVSCYKITPSETKEYLFFSSNSSGNPEIWIYNSYFAYVGDDDNGAGSLHFQKAITLNAGNTYYLILRHHESNSGTFRLNSYIAADIPQGSYWLRNTGSSKYMNRAGLVAQDLVHQWSRHTGSEGKWIINKESNGYYTIRSQSIFGKYVGISSTSTVEDNIKLYTSVSDNTRWKIYTNASNALLLVPKTASGRVLCAQNDTVGSNLRLKAIYDVATPNRSLWKIDSFTLVLNTYYDNAFNVRYGDGASLVSSFSSDISRILQGTVGLDVTMNSPTMITSTPDQCKLQRGLGITFISINMDNVAICPSNPDKNGSCPYFILNSQEHSDCENCTSWHQIYKDFIREFPGNSTTTSILFTGSKLYDDSGKECNRSYAWYFSGIVLQEIWGNSSEYADRMLSCLLHEISHQIGAPDHYHEIITNESGERVCRGGDLCIKCHPSTGRPAWCVMGDDGAWRTDLDICGMDEVYCEACLNEIIEHLIGHHYN